VALFERIYNLPILGLGLENTAIADGSMITLLPSREWKEDRLLNGNVIAFDTGNISFELS
jgi:hypothetical protein